MIAHIQDSESGIENLIQWLKENQTENPTFNYVILDNCIQTLHDAHKALVLVLEDIVRKKGVTKGNE